MSGTGVLSTMWDESDVEWTRRTTLLDRRRISPPRYLVEFVRTAPDYDAAVVVGSIGARDGYIDLVATVALKLRRTRPVVLVTDATWEMGSRTLSRWLGSRQAERLARQAIRVMDGPHIVYAVLSSAEARSFPAMWGVDAERVVFTPFSYQLWGREDDPVTNGGYLFAGGNSLRDYPLLAAAADGLGVPVRLATTWVPERPTANVEVGPVSPERFVELLLGATAVVVPLAASPRSAGQQTYLGAMAAGKVVIVTDAPGVRDYIDDRVTGLVVASDVGALRDAMEWVCDAANADEVAAMAARARSVARERFSPAAYHRRLLDICDHAVAVRR